MEFHYVPHFSPSHLVPFVFVSNYSPSPSFKFPSQFSPLGNNEKFRFFFSSCRENVRLSGCSSFVEWGLDKLLFLTHIQWSRLKRGKFIGSELFTYSRILRGRVFWINPPLRYSFLSFSARLFHCVWIWICLREIETVLTLCEENFASSRELKEKEIGRRVVKAF